MRTALFLFIVTSLHFYATVSAHARWASDPELGIDENCGINPDDPERETFLFLTRFGLYLQSSSSQVTPDFPGVDGGSGQGSGSPPFFASMVFSPGTNSATAPLLRRGGVVYSFSRERNIRANSPSAEVSTTKRQQCRRCYSTRSTPNKRGFHYEAR